MKFSSQAVIELTPTWKMGAATKDPKETEKVQSSGVQWTPPWGSALPPPLEPIMSNQAEKCPICFDQEVMESTLGPRKDTESNDGINIGTCRCQVCQGCLATWFVKHPLRPTCPVCLIALDRQQLVEALNMDPPIENKEDANKGSNNAAATTATFVDDDLTQDWFDEHESMVKQCPNPDCGVWIWKSGGCGHMTCDLCQYEFCWFCLKDMNDECNWECDGWIEGEEDEEDSESEDENET